MDKNTVIGLTLIGALLIGFTFLNQPSEAEKKKALAEQKALAEKQKKDDKKTVNAKDVASAKKAEEKSVVDSAETVSAPVVLSKGELYTLESDKIKVQVSTKGGVLASVELKEYETYNNFAKNDGKVTALALFKEGDQTNQLEFDLDGKPYKTGNKAFEVISSTKDKLVLSHKINEGSIEYTYFLKGGYDLGYSVAVKNLDNAIKAKDVVLDWKMAMRKTERLLSEQRKVSTICYEDVSGKLDWNSEVSAQKNEAENDISWVAYKQSYFSVILHPEDAFKKQGTSFTTHNYKAGNEKYGSHIRNYKSVLNLGLKSTKDGKAEFSFFFGPNDYNVLASYNSGYDDILNLGWGIFRWINLYAVQPVFNFLMSSGLTAGLAILLLTLVLKLILMPVQWKMFVSSAKMKILKPQIDEINAKYPNKEDAMKKQMDMMALYRESGASPLSGCVPMLFQMPILLAVFRFFPATFSLRQKGFLWAEDLSSYDSIWDFGTYLPLYGNHMSLFTLLMAGTTLAYTYLNSQNVTQQQQPGMPNMKVIMYIFPFMMIFFFNNFASGLSYYYFISTLMTIILMFVIKKFFVDEEKLKIKMANVKAKSAAKGKEPKKKSAFMQRLEEAQKQQQEKMKNKK